MVSPRIHDATLMTNLYARLVKLVQKREDFRTDALVDLLERLLRENCEKSTGRFREFVSEVLLADPTDKAQRACFLDMLKDVPLDALSIKTRYRIPQGRIPDIVVFNRSRPICIVEVKVDAPIGPGQLEGCGEFLRKAEDAHGKPTALVLLTHITRRPDEFIDPACNAYRVSLRSVASWSNTAEWFQKLSSEDNGVDEPLDTLRSRRRLYYHRLVSTAGRLAMAFNCPLKRDESNFNNINDVPLGYTFR